DPTTVTDAAFVLGGSGGPVPATVVRWEGAASLVPWRFLDPNASYTASLAGVTDEAGNPLPAFTATFTTGPRPDVTAPGLLSVGTGVSWNGPPNAPLEAVFSDPLNPAALSQQSLRVTQGTSEVPGSVELSDDLRVLRFLPAAPFSPSS